METAPMKKLLPLLAVLFVLPLLGSDSSKEYDDKVELDDVHGSWRLVTTARDGQVWNAPDGQYLTFRNNRYEWTQPGFCPAGDYHIDTHQRPAPVDMTRTNGPEAERVTRRYIYRIDGDTLTAAGSEDHREPPSAFSGAGVTIFTYKRVKK
jgi:uncharacterized protein (TIGR03067 family)